MKKVFMTLAGILFASLFPVASQCQAAGNLTVELSEDGVLSIQGDRESNLAFLAVRDNEIGALVRGPDEEAGLSVPIEDVSSIEVLLGDGNDRFTLWCQDILTANITVDTGRGDDGITCYGDLRNVDQRNPNSAIHGDFSINTGAQADSVSITGLVVTGLMSISTGHGEDFVHFSTWPYYDFDQNRWVTIPCEFDEGLLINTGQNDDRVHFATTPESDDVLTVIVGGDLVIQCGQGNDSIYISHDLAIVNVGGTALLFGGQGDDYLDERILANETIVSGFEN